MFYEQIKNMFNRVVPLKRPFARNMVLAWLFYLMIIFSVDVEPMDSTFRFLLFILALGAFFSNLLFGYLLSKIKYAYLYFLLTAVGGILGLLVLFIGSLRLIGLSENSLFVFWMLCVVSICILLYLNYTSLNQDFLKDFVKYEKPNYIWDIDRDIFAQTTNTQRAFLNLLKNFIAPLAPAFGMALSRNIHGADERTVIGFMILLLALIVSAGYIRFLALGLKLLYWQNVLNSQINVADSS